MVVSLKHNNMNEAELLDDIVDIVKESIAWEFETLDDTYLKDKLNEKYIIIKRETATE
jgi:hypothetical protein